MTSPQPPATVPPAITPTPLLSITVNDLLVSALEVIDACEDFDLESFLNDSPVLDEFTLFPKLYPEIQLKIWAHAYADLKGRALTIEPPLVEAPSLLHVCYNSRKFGLKIYTLYKYAARDGVPAFEQYIDFEKDAFDLTVRGTFHNPQGDKIMYRYATFPAQEMRFHFGWKDNLLMYSIHHYPDLCKQVKRITVRSYYLAFFLLLQKYHVPSNRLSFDERSFDGVFKMHFPALQSMGIVSNGVGEDPEYFSSLSAGQHFNRNAYDNRLFGFLKRTADDGHLKFKKIGPKDYY